MGFGCDWRVPFGFFLVLGIVIGCLLARAIQYAPDVLRWLAGVLDWLAGGN